MSLISEGPSGRGRELGAPAPDLRRPPTRGHAHSRPTRCARARRAPPCGARRGGTSRQCRTGSASSHAPRAEPLSSGFERFTPPGARAGQTYVLHPDRVRRNRMAPTPLQQLNEHGQSVWVDYLSRPFIEDGELAAPGRRRRPWRHLQPHDLPGRDRRGRRLRRAAPRGARDRERAEGDLPGARRPRHPGRLRRARARCTTRTATAGSRSRSTRTSPTTPQGTIDEAEAPARSSSTGRTCS